MKRYLVFTGESYYPSGGWDDFFGEFNFLSEFEKSITEEFNEDYKSRRFWADKDFEDWLKSWTDDMWVQVYDTSRKELIIDTSMKKYLKLKQ